jgi:hypothetical protein
MSPDVAPNSSNVYHDLWDKAQAARAAAASVRHSRQAVAGLLDSLRK